MQLIRQLLKYLEGITDDENYEVMSATKRMGAMLDKYLKEIKEKS